MLSFGRHEKSNNATHQHHHHQHHHTNMTGQSMNATHTSGASAAAKDPQEPRPQNFEGVIGDFGPLLDGNDQDNIQSHTYQLPKVLYDGDRKSIWDTCLGRGEGGGRSSITSIGPQLFMEIRKAFGVSEEGFLASLGIRQVIGGLLMGDMRGMAERVSEGRSGSLFYYSHDGKYMCKTICIEEFNCMKSMLGDYHR